MADDNDKFVEYQDVPREWLDQLKDDADVMIDQMYRAQEDMAFVDIDGGTWAGFLEAEFDGRTKLELDLVSEAVDTFVADWNDNRMGVEFRPNDAKTSDEDSELLNGIYRADFRDNFGKLSIDNAVDEAVKCGYGAWKQATRFEDDEDPENDFQQVEWRPIHSAYCQTIWDRASQWINKRDARRCVELIPFIKADFEEKYPGASPVSAYTPEVSEYPQWDYFADLPERIFIACRYDVVHKKETVFVYKNIETGRVEVYSKKEHEAVKAELRGNPLREFVRERKLTVPSVTKALFSGKHILEKKRKIVGKTIPIIPLYAYRSVVGGIERYRGVVRKLKDASRVFNMQVSQLAEDAASNGQEVPIFTPEQIKGKVMKGLWADKNNVPYLLCDPVIDPQTNQIVAAGPVGWNKPGQLGQAAAQLLNIMPAFIQSRTSATMEDKIDKDSSGKMVQQVVKRENRKTQNIMDNIANALTLDGQVYQGMAAQIYDEERIVKVLGQDGTESDVRLFETVLDPKSGKFVEANTLRGKKFKAFASTGPQYETQREQTVDELLRMVEVLSKIPAAEKYVLPSVMIAMQNMRGVGLDPIRKLLRRDMVLFGLEKPETEEEKQLVAAASQPKKDPTQDLMAAVTQKELSEAKNLEASTLDKEASAEKKKAEADKIRSEMQPERVSKIIDIRNRLLGRTGTEG